MRLTLLSILLAGLQVFSFGQQTLYESITHGGLQRDYILYVPEIYSPDDPTPLVFNFHGYTSNAFEQLNYGDFRPIADTAGFIIVHPQGTVDLLGNTHFNVGWGTSQINDIGFAGALIDSLSAMYNIDQDRVYSTGMSNGGFMSYYLACELSERIAAIASVTGSMNITHLANCSPSHPMPVMEIHGTADATVPYTGNIIFGTTPATIAYWVNYNNCESVPTILAIEDADTGDGCTAEHQIHADGDNGVTVEHYKIIDGQHTWPGSAFGGFGTNQDIDACKEIWRFFSQYDIHGLIQTTSTAEVTDHTDIKIYPNPATTFTTIEHSYSKPVDFTLSTMMGQVVLSGKLSSQKHQLDVSGISPGIYLFAAGQEVYKLIKAE